MPGARPRLVLLGDVLTGALSWRPHVAALGRAREVLVPELLCVECALRGAPLPAGDGVAMEADAVIARVRRDGEVEPRA